MRNIYLLWGLLTCIAFTSCYEEDALTPTEGVLNYVSKFPKERIAGMMTSHKYKKISASI